MKMTITFAASCSALLFTMHAQTTKTLEGHATVAVLTSTNAYEPNKSVQAAVRMTYDDGWHGYWINPGETGMKTEISWKLPNGWTATNAEFPIPERSSQSGIYSYNYHGTVLIPVSFIPPKDAKGDVTIEGEIAWLACDAKQCVAGNASVKLTLSSGLPSATADAPAILKAIAALPQASSTHSLLRQIDGKNVTLTVTGPQIENFDGAEILPVTEQALAPSHDWKFSVKKGICSATGPVNEYAEETEEMSLVLVVHGGKLPKPVMLRWSKKM
jgi:DsbC/DsbD-like thiol-disulfide interchange protein